MCVSKIVGLGSQMRRMTDGRLVFLSIPLYTKKHFSFDSYHTASQRKVEGKKGSKKELGEDIKYNNGNNDMN